MKISSESQKDLTLLSKRYYTVAKQLNRIISSTIDKKSAELFHRSFSILLEIKELCLEIVGVEQSEKMLDPYRPRMLKIKTSSEAQKEILTLTDKIEEVECTIESTLLTHSYYLDELATYDTVKNYLELLRREICLKFNLPIPANIFDEGRKKQKKFLQGDNKKPKKKSSGVQFPSQSYKYSRINFRLGYMKLDNGSDTTILPSVYLGVSSLEEFAIYSYLFDNFPHFCLEKRIGENRKYLDNWDIEIKITNANFKDLWDLKKCNWNNFSDLEDDFDRICFGTEIIQSETPQLFLLSAENNTYTAIIGNNNKSKLNGWFNFLKRGNNIQGDGSFLAGCLCWLEYNSELKSEFGYKHYLMLANLSISQVDLLSELDYSLEPKEVDADIFTNGCILSESEKENIAHHQRLQSNY